MIFSNSRFGDLSIFSYAKFNFLCLFEQCCFDGVANFTEARFFHVEFKLNKFVGWSDFSCDSDSKNKVVGYISFVGTEFHSKTTFANRVFDGPTEFSSINREKYGEIRRTLFKSSPVFHGAKIHQDTSFDNAIFDSPSTLESARAYRTLKLAMEQLKATREEQRFFRLEMKAERPSLPLPRRVLSQVYEWCSDYGLSLSRPLIALLVFSLTIGGVHGLLANACAERPQCAASAEPGTRNERTSDLIKYVLANVAPVPGLDKMQTELRKPLFGEHGGIAITAIALEILHKIIALVMTFLFALGLRNLFKMKS